MWQTQTSPSIRVMVPCARVLACPLHPCTCEPFGSSGTQRVYDGRSMEASAIYHSTRLLGTLPWLHPQLQMHSTIDGDQNVSGHAICTYARVLRRLWNIEHVGITKWNLTPGQAQILSLLTDHPTALPKEAARTKNAHENRLIRYPTYVNYLA